jgi:hypothetical protein
MTLTAFVFLLAAAEAFTGGRFVACVLEASVDTEVGP